MAAVEAGWTVIGIDNSETKVLKLNEGSSPVEDISDEQLLAAISTGSYKATSDFSLTTQASVVTICVPTPLNDAREPDLSLLQKAAEGIAPFLSNETLVVSESTSYPGTLRNIIIPTVNKLKSTNSTSLYFSCAPERVNPGDLVWSQKNTPRLLGSIDEASHLIALEFYGSICKEVVSVSSPEVAEAAKLLENTFRLVNIALINEFTQLCTLGGLSANEVIDAASTKPYGYMPFRPGVGVGGHCIPVDPLYLTWWARESGAKASLVESADSINRAMPAYIAKRAMELIDNKVEIPRVLILGVAYKPGVRDVRETPVSDLKNHLNANGARVGWHDPLVSNWENETSVDLNWECDLAILATNQPGLDLAVLTGRGVRILDCTNSYKDQPGVISL